jgi:uncharacterized membrane protein HdeD (DUF308 family)
MTTIDQDPVNMDPQDLERSTIAAIGEHWGVLLFLGIVSIVIGLIAMIWPAVTIVVIAILIAIWLIISGLFQIVRGFSSGLSGGMRALLFISGGLSFILGVIAITGVFRAVEIMAIFVGIAFLFRGFGSLFLAAEQKDGRGWNIFGGIIMLIGGFVVLLWPGISLLTLAWVTGIWLIVGGIFEVIAAFRLKGLAKKAAAA